MCGCRCAALLWCYSSESPLLRQSKGIGLTVTPSARLLSIETEASNSQKQYWSYFVDSPPAWVIGVGDQPRRESGSDEFIGQGMMVTVDGKSIHFRKGAGVIRLTGTSGEIQFHSVPPGGWRLWQDIDTPEGQRRVEMPWHSPQFVGGYNAVYGAGRHHRLP